MTFNEINRKVGPAVWNINNLITLVIIPAAFWFAQRSFDHDKLLADLQTKTSALEQRVIDDEDSDHKLYAEYDRINRNQIAVLADLQELHGSDKELSARIDSLIATFARGYSERTAVVSELNHRMDVEETNLRALRDQLLRPGN